MEEGRGTLDLHNVGNRLTPLVATQPSEKDGKVYGSSSC